MANGCRAAIRGPRLSLDIQFGTILFWPPQLSEHNILWPPGARAFFLHSNVLYNNIWFVTGGRKKQWGWVRNRRDPSTSVEITKNLDLFFFGLKCFLWPPITNYILLFSTLLCKKISRAPAGHKNSCSLSWRGNRIDPKSWAKMEQKSNEI